MEDDLGNVDDDGDPNEDMDETDEDGRGDVLEDGDDDGGDVLDEDDGWVDDPDDEDDGPLADGTSFADPGGVSALRAATPANPRNRPCPDCGTPNALTPADVRRHYCCDRCAERAERGGP